MSFKTCLFAALARAGSHGMIFRTTMEDKIRRLVHLVGTDPGFYVLALHSFVEHYIRDVLEVSDSERFPDLVWDLRDRLIEEANGAYVRGLSCLAGLGRQHKFTNAVRHGFGTLDPDEAVAATHLFLVFCSLVGISGTSELRRLESARDVWVEQRSLTEERGVLKAVQSELAGVQQKNQELLARLDQYIEAEHTISSLENQIERFTLELDETRRRVQKKDARVDELRSERQRLRDERRKLQDEMNGYRDLETYISGLGRLSVYTRTRMDYERTLMRLTPEQEEAVDAIDRDADFLVRGGAGTGKSLILIEALKRSLQIGELGFESTQIKRGVLLTFTRTLAKFENYVTTVLGVEQIGGLVRTVDAFILERLRRINPDFGFSFDIVDRLAEELNTTEFLETTELAAEIEVFLFGNFITRDEYTSDVIPRVGMRRRLSRGQREKVWQIRDVIAARMDESGQFSRNYARVKILEALRSDDDELKGKLRDVRTIYLDETQDLTAGDLIALKALINGHLVMASDLRQSIYGVSSPFVRAGLRIAGRTRVLRTNFRNTRQIHELAGKFLPPEEENLFAFRDGPIPELYTSDSPEALYEMLFGKLSLFTEQLEYDYDNICILAPHTNEVSRIHAELNQREIPSSVITDREFQFTETGAIRLSTLHSSKGLDFPVVLVCLPYLNRRERFDEETTDRLLRNLIYVGFTRAMENLNVFVCPGDDPILNEVVASFERSGSD